MGRHFWGTNGQKSFLRKYKKEYIRYRVAKKTRKFWPMFFSRWFAAHPEDRIIMKQRITQCKTWMGNHTGTREDGRDDSLPPADDDGNPPPAPPPPPPPPSKSAKARERRRLRKSSRDSKILALIRGRSKKYTLPAHQAYSHLHYDKVEHIIEASWAEHVEAMKKSNSAYAQMTPAQLADFAKDERLTVVNRELRRLFKSETEEVKQEVHEYRQKYSVDLDSMSEVDKRKNAVQNTAPLMKSLLPSLYRETGMTVSVLMAGRNPSSGNVVFRSFHAGKGEFGENFAQWHSNWDTSVKGEYVKYFESVEKANMAVDAKKSEDSAAPVEGNSVRLRPATDVDDDKNTEYEGFTGMDETHADSDDGDAELAEELRGKKKTRGPIDWRALFKANRIMNNDVQPEVTEESPIFSRPPSPTPSLPSRLPSPAPSLPSQPQNHTSPPPSRPPSPAPPPPNTTPPAPNPVPADTNPNASEVPPPVSSPAAAAASSKSTPLTLGSCQNTNTDAAATSVLGKRKVADHRDADEVQYVVLARTFLSVVLEGRCPTILEHWSMLEEGKDFPEAVSRKLGSDKLRPKEITILMAHHDYSNLTLPDDPFEFGRQWRAWWRDLQPLWRSRGVTWPLKGRNEMPNNPNWKTLSAGGKNGILLAILGIAIWLLSAKGMKSSAGRKVTQECEEALKDVDSVLVMMLEQMDEQENGRPAKRACRK